MRTRLTLAVALAAILAGLALQVAEDRISLWPRRGTSPPHEGAPVAPTGRAPSAPQDSGPPIRQSPDGKAARSSPERGERERAEAEPPSAASRAAPAAAQRPPAPRPAFHVVQPGETLTSIAERYGLSPEELARINRIVYRDILYAGDVLRLTDAPPRLQPHTTHVVRPGETLGGIARRHQVPLWALIEANELADPDWLPAGLTLKIPRVVYGDAD